jgi:L-seryl-tRNA(Ser) seleniumtransferase
MPNRRNFLQGLSSLPLLGSFKLSAAAKREYFKELGVRPFINAAGTYTTLTASLMPPEVVQAIEYASKQYVHLIELHDAVGKKIAEFIGCEAAMVSAGAASALTLGTAACMTGTNQEFIRRLPDTTGMKTEVIIQKAHRYGYDHAIRNCGTRFVEIGNRDELERAINGNTAMMMYFNAADPKGEIKAEEFVQLGKKHRIPTFNDAAADTPPLENLSKYTKMGFDLVTFSGGKGIRGPQSAGLLLGRKDLIEAARLNGPPNSDSIGRGMKVNKEELLAMMVAVELFVKKDHAAEWREWEKRVKTVADSVSGVQSIKTEQFVPEISNAVPHLRITWDPSVIRITPKEAVEKLRDGEPSIEVRPGAKDALEVAVWMMQSGEAQIVARRIREVLKGA